MHDDDDADVSGSCASIVDCCTWTVGFCILDSSGVLMLVRIFLPRTVPPQLQLPIILLLVLELDTGSDMNYQQTLLE